MMGLPVPMLSSRAKGVEPGSRSQLVSEVGSAKILVKLALKLPFLRVPTFSETREFKIIRSEKSVLDLSERSFHKRSLQVHFKLANLLARDRPVLQVAGS